MATGSRPRFRENVDAMRITWYDRYGAKPWYAGMPMWHMCKFRNGHFYQLWVLCVFFCGFLMMQVALDRLQNNAKHNDVM